MNVGSTEIKNPDIFYYEVMQNSTNKHNKIPTKYQVPILNLKNVLNSNLTTNENQLKSKTQNQTKQTKIRRKFSKLETENPTISSRILSSKKHSKRFSSNEIDFESKSGRSKSKNSPTKNILQKISQEFENQKHTKNRINQNSNIPRNAFVKPKLNKNKQNDISQAKSLKLNIQKLIDFEFLKVSEFDAIKDIVIKEYEKNNSKNNSFNDDKKETIEESKHIKKPTRENEINARKKSIFEKMKIDKKILNKTERNDKCVRNQTKNNKTIEIQNYETHEDENSHILEKIKQLRTLSYQTIQNQLKFEHWRDFTNIKNEISDAQNQNSFSKIEKYIQVGNNQTSKSKTPKKSHDNKNLLQNSSIQFGKLKKTQTNLLNSKLNQKLETTNDVENNKKVYQKRHSLACNEFQFKACKLETDIRQRRKTFFDSSRTFANSSSSDFYIKIGQKPKVFELENVFTNEFQSLSSSDVKTNDMTANLNLSAFFLKAITIFNQIKSNQ